MFSNEFIIQFGRIVTELTTNASSVSVDFPISFPVLWRASIGVVDLAGITHSGLIIKTKSLSTLTLKFYYETSASFKECHYIAIGY